MLAIIALQHPGVDLPKKVGKRSVYVDHFDGPTLEGSINSVKQFMSDVFSEQNEFTRKIAHYTIKYIEWFYGTATIAVDGLGEHQKDLSSDNASTLDKFAEECKSNAKPLEDLGNRLTNLQSNEDYLVIVSSNDEHFIDVDGRYYLPRDYEIIIHCLDDAQTTVSVMSVGTLPGYRYLTQALIFNWCYRGKSTVTLDQRRMINSLLLSLGKLFCLMYPDDISKQIYQNKMLEIMQKHKSSKLSENVEFLEIYNQFVEDLHKPRPPLYCRDIAKAIRKHQSFLESKFSPEDYYISPKGSASKVKVIITDEDKLHHANAKRVLDHKELISHIKATATHTRKQKQQLKPLKHRAWTYKRPVPSYRALKDYNKIIPGFIKSGVEADLLKDHPTVIAFDNYIGYESHYRSSPLPIGIEVTDYLARILTIENPSKYKDRIIHILCNSLQDRVNWIHRRLSKLLDDFEGDCTTHQSEMLNFALMYTSPFYVRTHKSSVICWDFDSATDKADQEATEYCLRLIFPEEVVSFWTFLCNLEQYVTNYVKDTALTESVKQTTGQLQGALASFRVFCLTHHTICRMDMLTTGRRDQHPREFYAIVGDDNIMNSITPDKILDPKGPVGFRSELELAHRKISSWFGYDINTDKSVFNYYDSEDEMPYTAEAIHCTIYNGLDVTAIPSRLLVNYVDPISAIASLVWASNHGYSKYLMTDMIELIMIRFYKKKLTKKYLSKHPNCNIHKCCKLFTILTVCGIDSAWTNFTRDEVALEMEVPTKRILLLFHSLYKFKVTFLQTFFSDEATIDSGETQTIVDLINQADIDLQSYLFDNLAINKIVNSVQDPEHKLMIWNDTIAEDMTLAMAVGRFLMNSEIIDVPVLAYFAKPDLMEAFEEVGRLLIDLRLWKESSSGLYDQYYQALIERTNFDLLEKASNVMRGRSLRRSAKSGAIQLTGLVDLIISTIPSEERFWNEIDRVFSIFLNVMNY